METDDGQYLANRNRGRNPAACGINPFVHPELSLTLAEVSEWEALVREMRAHKQGRLTPEGYRRLSDLTAKARPPLYRQDDPHPLGAA